MRTDGDAAAGADGGGGRRGWHGHLRIKRAGAGDEDGHICKGLESVRAVQAGGDDSRGRGQSGGATAEAGRNVFNAASGSAGEERLRACGTEGLNYAEAVNGRRVGEIEQRSGEAANDVRIAQAFDADGVDGSVRRIESQRGIVAALVQQ